MSVYVKRGRRDMEGYGKMEEERVRKKAKEG